MPKTSFTCRLDVVPNDYSNELIQSVVQVCSTYCQTIKQYQLLNGEVVKPNEVGLQIVDMNYPYQGDCKIDIRFITKVLVWFDYLGFILNGSVKYPELIENSNIAEVYKNLYKRLLDNEETASINTLLDCKTVEDVHKIYGANESIESQLNAMMGFVKIFDVGGTAYCGFTANMN